MAGMRAERAAQVRATIVETAERLFASRGFEATSLQRIADGAGIGKANLYHYFRTKADILDAALTSAMASVAVLLTRAAAVPAGEQRLRFILDGYLDLLVERRHRQPWGEVRGDRELDRRVRSTIEQMTERAASLVLPGPPTPAQRMLILQLLALQDAVPRFGSLSDDELRAVLHAACDALLTMPGTGLGPD